MSSTTRPVRNQPIVTTPFSESPSVAPQRHRRAEKALLRTIPVLFMVIWPLAASWQRDLLDMGCPILERTGFDCPLCGATRSANALAGGHIGQAADWNLLVPLVTGSLLVVLTLVAARPRATLRRLNDLERFAANHPALTAGVALTSLVTWGVLRNLVPILGTREMFV